MALVTLNGKFFFSNAGIKDRAEEYAKLFVDNRLVHNATNTLKLIVISSQPSFFARLQFLNIYERANSDIPVQYKHQAEILEKSTFFLLRTKLA